MDMASQLLHNGYKAYFVTGSAALSLDAVRNPTILSLVLGLTLGDWRDVTGTDLRKAAGCC